MEINQNDPLPQHIREKFEKAGIIIIDVIEDGKLIEQLKSMGDENIDKLIVIMQGDGSYRRRLYTYDLARIITQMNPSRKERIEKMNKTHIQKQEFKNRQRFHNKRI